MPTTSAVVLTKQDDREWLGDLLQSQWPREAPACLVFCLDYFALRQACPIGVDFYLNDMVGFVQGVDCAARTAQTVAQTARELRLGCSFLPQVLQEAQAIQAYLQLPPYVLPVTALAVSDHELPNEKGGCLGVHWHRYDEPLPQQVTAAKAWWERNADRIFAARTEHRLAAQQLQTVLLQSGIVLFPNQAAHPQGRGLSRTDTAAAIRHVVRTGLARRSFLSRTNVLLHLAHLALLVHRADQSQALLQEALALEPDAPDVLASLALVYQYKGLLDKSVSLLQRALPLSSQNEYLLYLLGEVYRQQGRKALAEANLRQVLAAQPQFAPAWLALAATLEDSGRFDDAVAVYEEARTAIGPNIALLNNEGLCLSNLGRDEEAAALYQEALKLRPDDPAIMANLALLLGQQGEFTPALAYYNRALRLRPRDPDLLNNKGFCLGKLGRYEEALRCYELALTVESGDISLLHNKASCLTRLGRYKEALECYDQVLQLNPTDTGTLNNRALCLMVLNRTRDALECLNLALKLEPDSAVLWGNKGACLCKQGKYTEALAAYERALALAPEELAYYSGKGMCLDYLGRAEEAVDCYNRALRLA
ncbi:MAG TPA: tetratricopeptide repeat protein [Firmicutes bacterium]|nr:tetratricopeptide repeat protein [Bacillota bacterium]